MTTRERLVDATEQLLWERGFAATSPAAIQQRAGAGQGSMYHHFGGKADLALAALGNQAGQLRDAFAAAVEGHEHAADKLLGYLSAERDALRGCRLGRHAQDADVLADEQLHRALADYFRWALDEVAAIVAAGKAAGELADTADPADLAALLIGVVQGGYVLARATGDVATYDAAVRAAAATVAALRLPAAR